MNTLTLIQAAAIISKLFKVELVSIEFEDGSGRKFNYKTIKSNEQKYIDLTGKI